MLKRIITLLLSMFGGIVFTLMFVLDKCNTFSEGTFCCMIAAVTAFCMLLNVLGD